jgi:hypothetical protein
VVCANERFTLLTTATVTAACSQFDAQTGCVMQCLRLDPSSAVSAAEIDRRSIPDGSLTHIGVINRPRICILTLTLTLAHLRDPTMQCHTDEIPPQRTLCVKL